MGLKIVCPVEYQRVKKVSLTAMPFRGEGGPKQHKNLQNNTLKQYENQNINNNCSHSPGRMQK
jgi:hypothetical protein